MWLFSWLFSAVQPLTCLDIPWWLDTRRLSEWHCRSGTGCGPCRSWTRRQSPPPHPESESGRSGTPCSVSAGERNPCPSPLWRDVNSRLIFFRFSLAARLIKKKHDFISCVLFEKGKYGRANRQSGSDLSRRVAHSRPNPNILTPNKSTFQFIKSVNWIQVASSQTGPLLCA